MPLNLKKNAVWALVEVVTSSLVLFFLYKIIVGKLGIEAVGIWSLVLATTSLGSLADIGTAAGLSRFVAIAQARHDKGKTIGCAETAIITNLFLYAGLSLLIWVPAYYGLSLTASGEALGKARELLPYALLSFVLMNVAGATTGALVGQQRSDQRSMVSIISLVVQFIVAFLFVPHYGIPALAWAQIAQYLLINSAAWGLFLRNHYGTWKVRIPIHWQKDMFRDLVGFGIKLQAASLVSFLFEPAIKFIMSSLGGLEALGYFEMSQRLVKQARQLVVMPNQIMVPGFAHFMETEPEKVEPIYHKTMALTLSFGFPLFAGLMIFSPVICHLWIGHAVMLFNVFTIFMSACWFANLVSAPAYLLAMAGGRVRWNFYGSAVTTFGGSVLAFALGHAFGAYGVAFAAGAMLAAGALLSMIMNCRLLKVVALPSRDDFRVLFYQAVLYVRRKYEYRPV